MLEVNGGLLKSRGKERVDWWKSGDEGYCLWAKTGDGGEGVGVGEGGRAWK